MEIAYYEENNYHTEIFGTFLYYFKNNNMIVTVYNNSDKSDYIGCFKKIYNFELKNTNELVLDHQKYRYIVIGTSYSIDHIKCIYNEIKNKIIPICHLKENINNDITMNCIVLTPLNIVNSKCHKILPIHNFTSEHGKNTSKNIFVLVGRFKDNNRDTHDLLFTLNKFKDLNFEVHIFVRHIKFVPKSLINFSNTYPNKLKIFFKTKTETLEKQLVNSKFMLTLAANNSCYHNDRLSGIIPLSFNYNIPIIMDKKLNDIYGFSSCITYKNSLSEIIEYVVNIGDNEYHELVNNVRNEKSYIIEANNIILSNLIK